MQLKKGQGSFVITPLYYNAASSNNKDWKDGVPLTAVGCEISRFIYIFMYKML